MTKSQCAQTNNSLKLKDQSKPPPPLPPKPILLSHQTASTPNKLSLHSTKLSFHSHQILSTPPNSLHSIKVILRLTKLILHSTSTGAPGGVRIQAPCPRTRDSVSQQDGADQGAAPRGTGGQGGGPYLPGRPLRGHYR